MHINLPELKGTEKQITWAVGIREKALNKIYENMERAARNNYYQKEDTPIVQKAIQMALDKQESRIKEILKHTDAKWWIDNRHILQEPNTISFTDIIAWGDIYKEWRVAGTETYTIIHFKSFIMYYKKALKRLEKAKATGEKQRVVRVPEQGIVFFVYPNGNITLEKEE